MRFPGPAVACIASLSLAPAIEPATARPPRDPAPAGWSTYLNTRYHYDICYPPAILKPQGEKAAGDGQVFSSDHGAELTVFWSSSIDGAEPQAEADDEAAAMSGGHPRITFQAQRENWAVRSGFAGDRIFYTKVIRPDADGLLVLAFAYPRARQTEDGAILRHLVACFEPSRPGAG